VVHAGAQHEGERRAEEEVDAAGGPLLDPGSLVRIDHVPVALVESPPAPESTTSSLIFQRSRALLQRATVESRWNWCEEKAQAPYRGITPLTPEDVVECAGSWARPRTSTWTAST
jgi:hypothetical protein